MLIVSLLQKATFYFLPMQSLTNYTSLECIPSASTAQTVRPLKRNKYECYMLRLTVQRRCYIFHVKYLTDIWICVGPPRIQIWIQSRGPQDQGLQTEGRTSRWIQSKGILQPPGARPQDHPSGGLHLRQEGRFHRQSDVQEAWIVKADFGCCYSLFFCRYTVEFLLRKWINEKLKNAVFLLELFLTKLIEGWNKEYIQMATCIATIVNLHCLQLWI